MNNKMYEMVTVFDIPMLFTCERIDHKTIPEELFVYEVRHDDECQGIPCEIARYISVNHWGTLIANKPLKTIEEGEPIFIDENDWNYLGESLTLKTYMEKYPFRYIINKTFWNTDIFQIVDRVPYGYMIWNIGKNMRPGYLPLCRLSAYQPFEGARWIERDTLKAIKIDGAQVILEACGAGHDTIEEMEKFVQKYSNASQGTWHYAEVQRIKKALPFMKQIRWS